MVQLFAFTCTFKPGEHWILQERLHFCSSCQFRSDCRAMEFNADISWHFTLWISAANQSSNPQNKSHTFGVLAASAKCCGFHAQVAGSWHWNFPITSVNISPLRSLSFMLSCSPRLILSILPHFHSKNHVYFSILFYWTSTFSSLPWPDPKGSLFYVTSTSPPRNSCATTNLNPGRLEACLAYMVRIEHNA